jgi:hypothetical protein
MGDARTRSTVDLAPGGGDTRLVSSRLALVVLAALTSACALSRSHRPPENPNLHHVKRVFVPQQIDPDEKALAQLPIAERQRIEQASSVPTRLANFLAEALANRGFVIVRTESESDATITLESLEPIVVDGPLPNQQFGFAATVRSPSLGVNWRTAISSLVKETHPVAERRNMETIARDSSRRGRSRPY